jgi:hypothetical protein
MKKGLIFTVAIICVTKLLSQPANDTSHVGPAKGTREFYLQQSKKQRSAGTGLLVVGSIATVTGIIIAEHGATTSGGIIFLVGVVTMISTSALFIAASKNKRKAYSMALNIDSLMLPAMGKAITQHYATLTFRIRI